MSKHGGPSLRYKSLTGGGLYRIPNHVGGNPNASAERKKWFDIKCPSCGGPFWATQDYIHKMHGRKNKSPCRKCREGGRLEGLNAAIAVAKRKKEMGIRW